MISDIKSLKNQQKKSSKKYQSILGDMKPNPKTKMVKLRNQTFRLSSLTQRL